MDGRVFVNGVIVAPHEAHISVFDRGFLYGDSVFETLRVYNGVPFKLAAHLERLAASGQRVGFALPWSAATLRQNIADTIAAARLDDAYVRVIGTRGTGAMGVDPALAQHPSLIIMALPLPPLPPTLYTVGRTAALVQASRHDGMLDPAAKTGNYLNSVMATQQARTQHAEEAIMCDPSGLVAEGSNSNIFALCDGVWCTPPLHVGILGGITRQTLLNLCRERHVPVEERELHPADLHRAAEIFLCASIREIVPIIKLDGEPVGNGRPGRQTQELHQWYRACVARP